MKPATLEAAKQMDWRQVVLNNAAPCFHVCDDGRFCGRAERWHGHEDLHGFVSLEQLLRGVLDRAAVVTSLAELDRAVADQVEFGVYERRTALSILHHLRIVLSAVDPALDALLVPQFTEAAAKPHAS